MIKLIGLMTRKEGMSVQDYQTYWRDVHAPMIAKAPYLRRYVQSHAIPELYGEYAQAYDGMAEAWFDSLEDYAAAVASPEWQVAVVDAPNFIGKSVRLMATEVPIIGDYESPRERESMVKYSGFLTRKPGLSVEEMQTHWREIHAPLVREALPTMTRYIQNHAILETYDRTPGPAFDGVPQAWFPSMDAYPRGLGKPTEGPPTSPSTIDSYKIFVQPIRCMLSREVTIVG